MRRITALLFALSVAIQFCFAPTKTLSNLPLGWERVYIKNIGRLDLPPTMEVQKGIYKQYVDEERESSGLKTPQLTAQQKGLNELSEEGFGKYARVIVEATYGSPGDFEKLNFNISKYTQTDINELNSMFKQQGQLSLLGTGIKIIEWHPLKIEKVNGMSCMHLSYIRQLHDKPYVLVSTYIFPNNDRLYKLTLSYRISESAYWKNDFVTILKSFRITNTR